MIPIGDFARRRTRPYVNWALICLNFLVFFYTLTLSTTPDLRLGDLLTSPADRFLIDWGFEPACLSAALGFATDASPRQMALTCTGGGHEVVKVFTSLFVHAGWAHIIGNMLFLWIFGDNVEDRVGHLRYLVFYLLCGLAAALVQTYMSADSLLPTVGASGAIAGVLAAYLVLSPFAMVQVLLFFIPIVIPAALLIVLWFITQLFSGLAEIGQASAGSGIAFWAHIGGFITGGTLIWFFKQPRARPRAWQND